ncbi:MAG TPA: hypothetical protein PJ988_19815 [Anaerolinea sp.]|nr:hypothetical protein [Anaerolinea sp.]
MSSKPEIKPAIAPNPAAPADAAPPPPHDAMRRLQIGIAGGVTVLLLIVLTVLTWVENRLIKPDLSVLFIVFAADRAGIVDDVRKTFQENCSHIDYFRLDHHIRRQRVRINTLIKLHSHDKLGSLSVQLSSIPGVKIVKYE